MQLPISNIINISVSSTPLGLSNYNTSNLAIITSEAPGVSFTSGYAIYKEPAAVAADFGTSSVTYKMALAVFSQAPNILANDGYLVVIPLISMETVQDAIIRTKDLVQYFGVMTDTILSGANMLLVGAVVQALNKVDFMVQKLAASVEPGGSLDLVRTGGLWKSRGLFYDTSTDLDAILYQAAYAGRALSTVFSGSNTTQNMHLKELATIQPDPNMTQTLLGKAKAAGADIYPSFAGLPKLYTSGKNKFFDQVYNLGWFVGALEIAGFNYLAQASTKVPQTEQGMDGLKGAYRKACQQAISNAYGAPGVWNSPTTFGDQADMLANIKQIGYYIFSSPIALQSQADREERVAPLVQIALKEAGGSNSSTAIVNVNA